MSKMKFTPEFAFVAAACRWPLTDRQGAELRKLASGSLDWQRVARVVRRQRVAGLVREALAHAGVEPPAPFTENLDRMTRLIARQNLLATVEMARLQRLFDAEGIPVIFLKGLCLAQLAYGSLSFKHGRDIDILTSQEDAKAAWRLLEREQYQMIDPSQGLDERRREVVVRYGREVELIHKDGFPLDLHWGLASNPVLFDESDVWADARPVPVFEGLQVLTLGDADLFTYLCVHGAYHAWSRLKWLADLSAFLSAKSEAEIVALYRQAEAKGGGLCAGQALLLCRTLLGVEPPAALQAELDGSARLRRLTEIALDAMVGPDGETELHDRKAGMPAGYLIYLSHILLGRGPRYHAHQIKLFFNSVGDRVRVPLPRPLYFLYPILRLPLLMMRTLGAARA